MRKTELDITLPVPQTIHAEIETPRGKRIAQLAVPPRQSAGQDNDTLIVKVEGSGLRVEWRRRRTM